MIPKAKKNLHQCQYHLNTMRNAKNSEELEIGYCAFVIAARSVTFVLQKEFSDTEDFEKWYDNKKDALKADPISVFFVEQRNSVVKEGINALSFSTKVKQLNLPEDELNKPKNATTQISARGLFYLVNEGTPAEDLLPANHTSDIVTTITLNIDGKPFNVLEICEGQYLKLKELTEEWTGILNQAV